MPISTMLPCPRWIKFAGGIYKASELRLCDLAYLESWAGSRIAPPLTGIDETAADYGAKLRAAYESCAAWPPAIDDDRVDQQIHSTPGGLVRLLRRVLRRHKPRLTAADLVGLIAEAEDLDWKTLVATAYGDGGKSLWLEVVQRIDRHLGIEPFAMEDEDDVEGESSESNRGRVDRWPYAIARVCGSLRMSPTQVGKLTITQWRMLTSDRVPRSRVEPLPADPELEVAVMAKRGEFWRDHHDAEMAQDAEHDAEVAAVVAQYYTERPNLPKPPWIWPGEPPEGFARPNSQPPLEE